MTFDLQAISRRYLKLYQVLPLLLLLIFGGVDIVPASEVELKVRDLTVEYLENPIGINSRQPRLSWRLLSNLRGTDQQAYQVLVASSPEKLTAKKADLWNSGRVSSDQNINVEYRGKPLDSYDECYWQVRVWDNRGKVSEWSEVGRWKMGILKRSEWDGEWIASDLDLKPYQDTLRELEDFERVPRRQIWQWSSRIRKMTRDVGSSPAVYFRKNFTSDRSIEHAFVAISGLGLYNLFINGERIGHELNPAYTDYEVRLFYNMYEVTDEIRSGENSIGVILGNGWYNLIIPHALRYYAADYIAPPKMLMELQIRYSDGTTRTIATDTSWKFTTEGPIRFNDVLGGETHDARKAIPGWNTADYDDSTWQRARLVEGPEGELQAQMLHPVRKVDTLKPARIEKRNDTVTVDFGQELTGWVRVRIRGESGDTVVVRHPGAPQHTLGRYQTDKYILDGGDPDTFEPRFSYKGFQRLVITGLDYQPESEAFTAFRVQSDLPRAGTFRSSHGKLDKLQAITRYTLKNYNVHLPNDPTREKAGWTQDAQNAFDANAYNFDAAPMYQKWQQDLLDIQYENGYVPPVAPGRFDGHHINGPWWGGMIVYLPWKLYRHYGDRQMLARSYPAMKKYVGYLESIADSHIVSWGLGDWREPGTHRPQNTPVNLTSTVAYYNYTRITSETAAILGDSTEFSRYRKKAGQIKKSYNETFYDTLTHTYATGSQASQLLSLYFKLVPETEIEKVKASLVDRIRSDSLHLTTGFVATPYLLNGLTEMGYAEVAYELATQETYPGWFDMVFNRDHSVLKESWKGGGVQMPSLAGSISWYFYRSLAGIRPAETAPGFKHFVIEPAMVEGLERVQATYESLYGTVTSNWEKTEDGIRLQVEIPANTVARVYLPAKRPEQVSEGGNPVEENPVFREISVQGNKTILKLGSGTYEFVIR